MLKVYKDSSPSFRTVYNQVAEFKRGRKSLEDEPRQGRPKTALTPEIAKIQDMFLEDRQLFKKGLVEALSISDFTANHILTEVLGLKKLCAQWVPYSLTVEQKHIRMRLSQQHLQRFKRNKKDFVRRFCASLWMRLGCTTMILNQNKRQSNGPNPILRLRVRVQKSAKKIMASVFWDAKGILLVDYL